MTLRSGNPVIALGDEDDAHIDEGSMAIKNHSRDVHMQHAHDLDRGYGKVYLPFAQLTRSTQACNWHLAK